MAGTLTWQHLADDDPVKLAAVLDGGQHWALRVDTVQAALAQASHDISAAADWPAFARGMRQRSAAYIRRRSA